MCKLSTAISSIIRINSARQQYDISIAVNEMLSCLDLKATFQLSATGDAVLLVTAQGEITIIGAGCNHFVRASCARFARLLFLGRGYSDPYHDEGDIAILTNALVRNFHVKFNNTTGVQFLQVFRIL